MKKKTIISVLACCLGLSAGAQQYLSPDVYRAKVEAYSQVLKQQHLKTFASTQARKIATTGFLPKIDITAEGTANLNHLDQWHSPTGDYRPYTYQALATLTQPLYTGGSLIAQKKLTQADEELDKLTTELTLDQIHYQSDAIYWNASAARASLQAAAAFLSIVQRQYDLIQDRFNDGAISRTDLLMISTRRKEAELQYIKARQAHTLALQQLNILMGAAPNTPIDSLSGIDTPVAPVHLLSLDEVLPRRAEYASTSVNIARSRAQRLAALSRYNPQVSMFLATGWDTGIAYDDRIAEVHIGISHVNLCTEHHSAFFDLTAIHLFEKFEAFFDRTIPVRTFHTRLGRSSFLLCNLFGSLLIDICFSFLYKADSEVP